MKSLKKSTYLTLALLLVMSMFAITVSAEDVVINDFSSELMFAAGTNTTSVSLVTSFANTGDPEIGSKSIEAMTDGVDANMWRTIVATGSWDLSGATGLYYHINSYGGVGDKYETNIKVTNGAGQSVEKTYTIINDEWNRIDLDISGLTRNNVTSIKISFRADSNFGPWGGNFQLDVIGYVAGVADSAPAGGGSATPANPQTGDAGTLAYVLMALIAVAGIVTFRRFARTQQQ